MSDLVKRLAGVVKLGAVAGIAVGLVRRVTGSAPPEVTGQASWPPLTTPAPTPTRTGPVQFATTTSGDRWVAPVDGTCPVSHPIKGNRDSGIFHVPGGMSYERTVPERCYATEADAEADGFRRAKR